METKFTKGEWTHHIQPQAPTGLIDTINSGTKRIAELIHVGIEETRANSKLIIAAPDLLNAAKGIVENFPVGQLKGVRKDFSKMVALAALTKAIHKATATE